MCTQIYNSIDAPIEFNKVKNERYQKVIERLKDIRNAQVAFKSVNGIYSDNFDSLVNTLTPSIFGSDLFQAYSSPLLSLSERASGLC